MVMSSFLQLLIISWLAVWLRGNALVLINEVTLHWARLVLGWVTVSGVQLPVWENLFQYITSHARPTQPGHPSMGRHNEAGRYGS